MSLFRIAYCIECHKYTPILQELVDRLHGPDAEIYIHVDGKVSLSAFHPLRNKVHFIEPRTKVYWGHFSQIACMLRLFKATQQSDCRYIVLLSGDTLPLCSSTEIRDFLAAQYASGAEFIDISSELCIAEMMAKMRSAHYVPVKERRQWRFNAKYKFSAWFLPKHNRRFVKLPPLNKGSNWITISDHFRDYVFEYLNMHPDYLRSFKHSSCGDELFFQTIIGSSPFARHNTRHSLLFADWACTHPPRIFGNSDIDAVRPEQIETTSGFRYLFARKFADDLNLTTYRRVIHGEEYQHKNTELAPQTNNI